MSMQPTTPGSAAERRTVIQLVSPGTGGVLDYLNRLRDHWAAAQLDNEVIVLSEADARELSLAVRLRRSIDFSGRPCSLLVHYSGYGYDRRGVCRWLLREIERARQELGESLRVVTMIHELYAFGPPWRSAFWLGGAQAWVAAGIARASDALWTNTECHARWLRARVGSSIAIETHPVFSTVGEPQQIAPAGGRAHRLVVFGSQSTRARALARLPRHVDRLRLAGICEIIEAGSGEAHRWNTDGLAHRFVGRLDASALGSLLESSAYGLLDYPPKYLGKSTVFAAYAVHGCVALNTAEADRDTDGLQPRRHFVTLSDDHPIPDNTADRQTMADAGRAWYAPHRSDLQAAAFARTCLADFALKEAA